MAVKVSRSLVQKRPAASLKEEEPDLLPPPVKQQKLLYKDEVLKLRKAHFCEAIGRIDSTERIVRAFKQYMYTDTGIRYLDLRNNVHHVGHCHPKVVEAGVRQMSLLNTNSRFLHDAMSVLAQRLSNTLPGNLDCCFFTNSGSEANDLALQIAEMVTGNTEIIAIKGGYHGHLKSLRAISQHPLAVAEGQTIPDNIHMVEMPDVYRGIHRDPVTAGQLYAEEVKQVIDDCHRKGKKMSTFIAEPIPCCGGVIVPPKDYFKIVYDAVHKAGGLCIADEVQTGFGRVGSHFWAFQIHDVIPDIVTIGKPMGNGHPVAAVITTRDIADRFAASGVEYFNTFGGNPVSMAIATSVLDVIEEEKLQQRAQYIGAYLYKRLKELESVCEQIGDVRGAGLMVGVEIVKDKDSREPDQSLANRIIERLANEYFIFALTDGLDGNVLKIKPPICISDEDVDHFIESLKAILNS